MGTTAVGLPKTATGIAGFDDVTGGGLPLGRPTLVCGPAGCGKTLFAIEFLVRGITDYGEPGVFVAFEESAEDLTANVQSLGFDLATFEAQGLLVIDHPNLTLGTLEQTGEWDLDGLLIRIGAAIDEVGAKRIAIDTLETLFGIFKDAATLRHELRRLFSWLKQRGITAVITGERGEGALTRYGIEEYVSDCVIVLDHRVTEQTSTRRLRILKYRGSLHGTNEYPFLIGESGISVVPITSAGLQHEAYTERRSTGVPRLDTMLGGGGYYRGSTVLVSGLPGTGKSTLAAQFCDAVCAQGDRAIYFSFEESESQIVRDTRSVGIDLQRWVDAGLLRLHCFRPSVFGLEEHLLSMQNVVAAFDASAVVMDPISDFLRIGSGSDVTAMLTRQIDFLKGRGVTTLFTSLSADTASGDESIASLVDTWLLVRTLEGNGENNRVLTIRKSRGMAHSNQIREFLLTEQGIELVDVYIGPQGVLTGSARQAQEAEERSVATVRAEGLAQRRADLQRKREAVDQKVAALWREFENEEEVVGRLFDVEISGDDDRAGQSAEQSRLRRADVDEMYEPTAKPHRHVVRPAR